MSTIKRKSTPTSHLPLYQSKKTNKKLIYGRNNRW